MTKTAVVAVLIAASLTGCAGAQKREQQQARCQEQPQWTTTDAAGQAVGIYICFGERSQLLYAVRILPPPPPAPAPAAPPKVKLPELAPRPRVKAPTAAPAQLPTLGGTAK